MRDTGLLSRQKAILGVAPGDGAADVKKKARILLMRHHPDRNPGNKTQAEEKVKEIIAAYRAVLSHYETVEAEKSRTGEKTGDAGRSADEVLPETAQFLTFELSGRKFAIPMSCVRSVLRADDINISDIGIYEGALPYAAGAFTLGREIALLWNIHRQLSLAEPPITSKVGRSKIIVVDSDGSPIGFIANEIGNVIDIDRGGVAPIDTADALYGSRLVTGMADLDNDIFYILDVDMITSL